MRGGEYWEEQKAHKIVSICRKKCKKMQEFRKLYLFAIKVQICENFVRNIPEIFKKIKTESDFLGRCFLGGIC